MNREEIKDKTNKQLTKFEVLDTLRNTEKETKTKRNETKRNEHYKNEHSGGGDDDDDDDDDDYYYYHNSIIFYSYLGLSCLP